MTRIKSVFIRNNITFMNNLFLKNVYFNNLSNHINNTNWKFHNNLFLSECDNSFPSNQNTTYNLVFRGNVNINDINYNSNGDTSCGQMGEYQSSMYFENFMI